MGTDRNKVAKEVRIAEDFQKRRKFINLLHGIRQLTEVLEFHKIQKTEFETQLKVEITEKDKDGNLLTERSLRTSIFSLNHQIENYAKNMMIMKEDLMNLMNGRSIKVFQEEATTHYEKVEEFYRKNVV